MTNDDNDDTEGEQGSFWTIEILGIPLLGRAQKNIFSLIRFFFVENKGS